MLHKVCKRRRKTYYLTLQCHFNVSLLVVFFPFMLQQLLPSFLKLQSNANSMQKIWKHRNRQKLSLVSPHKDNIPGTALRHRMVNPITGQASGQGGRSISDSGLLCLSRIHSFKKELLRASYMPGSVLNAGDSAVNEDKELMFWWQETGK